MKTLQTIQSLSKLGKVFSTIAFVCALVGVCLCVAGLVMLPMAGGEILKLGGVSLYGLLGATEWEGLPVATAALNGYLALCAGEAILAKFAQRYFARELVDGTPFTLAGARELTRLGILTIVIPTASAILGEILQNIIVGVADVEMTMDMAFDGNESSVTLGICFILVALLCRCGAELGAGKKENADARES